jgi:catechol 2,3-dioxygenase
MTTRRQIMKLAVFAGSQAALAGAARAEGSVGVVTPEPVVAPLPFAQTTPMRIGAAALRVRDLAKVRRYYVDLLKFSTISESADEVVLGAGNVPLLHLMYRPEASPEGQRNAGLYHIAFLMPSRADFARWLVHAALARMPFDGFADHNVSEASYLTDPEGNGIEVYSDRPSSSWQWAGDTVIMGAGHLDIENIVAGIDTTRDQYSVAPKALRIGHVHLRVGDVTRGREFYEGLIGMAPTRLQTAGVAFLSSGRYHHHIAINTWQSAGAGPRGTLETGLSWFSLAIDDTALLVDCQRRLTAANVPGDPLPGGVMVADPWGTNVRLISV